MKQFSSGYTKDAKRIYLADEVDVEFHKQQTMIDQMATLLMSVQRVWPAPICGHRLDTLTIILGQYENTPNSAEKGTDEYWKADDTGLKEANDWLNSKFPNHVDPLSY